MVVELKGEGCRSGVRGLRPAGKAPRFSGRRKQGRGSWKRRSRGRGVGKEGVGGKGRWGTYRRFVNWALGDRRDDICRRNNVVVPTQLLDRNDLEGLLDLSFGQKRVAERLCTLAANPLVRGPDLQGVEGGQCSPACSQRGMQEGERTSF